MTNPNQPNYAFIDNQNLNMGTRSEGWRVDWFKFRQLLSQRFGVTQAYMFIGYLEEYKLMYEQLSGYGFEVIFKPTVEIKDKDQTVKGNVDVELVLQVMRDYDNYHQAVIVSGDGDFYSLIKYLVATDKLRALLVPSRKYSNLLREFETQIVHVNQLRDEMTHYPANPKPLSTASGRRRSSARKAPAKAVSKPAKAKSSGRTKGAVDRRAAKPAGTQKIRQ